MKKEKVLVICLFTFFASLIAMLGAVSAGCGSLTSSSCSERAYVFPAAGAFSDYPLNTQFSLTVTNIDDYAEVYLDGDLRGRVCISTNSPVASCPKSPYSFTLSPSSIGEHKILIKAIDTKAALHEVYSSIKVLGATANIDTWHDCWDGTINKCSIGIKGMTNTDVRNFVNTKEYTFYICSADRATCTGANIPACGTKIIDNNCGGTITCNGPDCAEGLDCSNNNVCVANVVPAILAAAWRNNQLVIIQNPKNVYEIVNLTISGTDLKAAGRKVHYTITNTQTNKEIQSFVKTAVSDTFDTINWTINESGTFTFKAELYNSNTKVSELISSNTLTATFLTRLVPCNTTTPDYNGLPANAEYVLGLDKFTQTWKGSIKGWRPFEKNITLGNEDLECYFICNTGYSWDSDTKSCLSNPLPAKNYCSEYLAEEECNADADLISADNKKTENILCGTFSTEQCATYTCSCDWDLESSACITLASATGYCENPDCEGTCTKTAVIQGEDCSNGAENIIVDIGAQWAWSREENVHTGCTQPSDCISEQKTFDCASAEELPFFGWFNFAVSLIAVACVYFFLRRKL